MLIPPLCYLFYGFGLIFVTCELCQRMTNGCEEFIDVIQQFDWYLFAFKIQRILPTILINVQQPVYFECFGSIACDRKTFKQVEIANGN